MRILNIYETPISIVVKVELLRIPLDVLWNPHVNYKPLPNNSFIDLSPLIKFVLIKFMWMTVPDEYVSIHIKY